MQSPLASQQSNAIWPLKCKYTLLFAKGWLWVSGCGEAGKGACFAEMPWRELGCW